jgi:hypothetical protein
MFASAECVLAIGIDAAQTTLANLSRDGSLSRASHAAYRIGIDQLHRAKRPDLAGAWRLVRVQLLEPVYDAGSMSIGMRWEAIGANGALFPALDADITLSRENNGCARLALTGCYRPPLARPGACSGKAVLHNVAEITLRSMVINLAASFEGAVAEGALPARQ